MQKKIWIGAGVAVAVAATACAMWTQRVADQASVPTPAQSNEAAPFVRSFMGTTPDGKVATGTGELILDERLLERFDYYLSAQGEQTLPAIQAAIERDLAKELKPEAAAEGRRLLGVYVDYKRALGKLDAAPALQGDALGTLKKRLQAVRALRTQFFKPYEIKAFYGKQDALEDDTLARLEIQQDPSLSPAQKTARLAALDAQLSPEALAARQAPVQVLAVQASVEAARKNGATDAQVFALRSAQVGTEAAGRLAEVDKEEAEWKSRIGRYQSARNQLLAQQPDGEPRKASIQQLRDSLFSAQEQLRLPAYE